MRLPDFVGNLIYIVGYPILRLALWRSNRAYVVLLHDNTVLLIKNWLRYKAKWRLPGGGMHRGEQPVQAAVRELHEELGIATSADELHQLNKQPLVSRFGYRYTLFAYHAPHIPQLTYKPNDIIDHVYLAKTQLQYHDLDEEPVAALRLLNWL